MKPKKEPLIGIITGQLISNEKAALARDYRHNMTEAERILWRRLRANRLAGWHFRRQQVIAGYIVDFYCHKACLVIEVDGGIHQTQIEYDQDRKKALEEIGLRVLRFPNEKVINNIDAVLKVIVLTCCESENVEPGDFGDFA